jgi:hypothetical protein
MSGGILLTLEIQLEKVAILLDNQSYVRKFQIMVFIKWHQQLGKIRCAHTKLFENFCRKIKAKL